MNWQLARTIAALLMIAAAIAVGVYVGVSRPSGAPEIERLADGRPLPYDRAMRLASVELRTHLDAGTGEDVGGTAVFKLDDPEHHEAFRVEVEYASGAQAEAETALLRERLDGGEDVNVMIEREKVALYGSDRAELRTTPAGEIYLWLASQRAITVVSRTR